MVNKNIIFLSPFLLYSFISLFLFISIPEAGHLENDSTAYLGQLSNYETYGSFVAPGVTTCTHWYGVGYPIFLAGARTLLGHTTAASIFAQIILGLLILLLTYRIARLYFNESVALLALYLASINLGFLVYAQYFLSDLLFCLLLVAGFERLSTYLIEGFYTPIIVQSGLLFGISMWLKPAALYLMIFYVGILFYHKKKAALLFILGFMFFLSGLMIRNYQAYGYPFCLGVDKVNLYQFFLPKLIAETESMSIDCAKKKANDMLTVTEYASGKGWEKAAQYLKNTVVLYPFIALKIWMINVIKTLLGFYSNQAKLLFNLQLKGGDCSFFNGTGSWLNKIHYYISFGANSSWLILLGWFELFLTLCRWFLVILSLFYLGIKRTWLKLLLFCSYGGYFAVITGCDGCGRLRLAFEPLLVVLTAYSIFLLYQFLWEKRRI